MFERIHLAGLLLNPEKCEFFKTSISFLGYVVSAEGIKTDPIKIEKVADFPRPRKVKEICQFLGLASYYRRFIPHFATISHPLRLILKKGATITWNDKTTEA